MPRFVILEHDHPFPHLDFMIESGDRLRTWRLPNEPAPGVTFVAEAIGDHRKDYLDYEGARQRMKQFIGFSDNTALLLGLHHAGAARRQRSAQS